MSLSASSTPPELTLEQLAEVVAHQHGRIEQLVRTSNQLVGIVKRLMAVVEAKVLETEAPPTPEPAPRKRHLWVVTDEHDPPR